MKIIWYLVITIIVLSFAVLPQNASGGSEDDAIFWDFKKFPGTHLDDVIIMVTDPPMLSAEEGDTFSQISDGLQSGDTNVRLSIIATTDNLSNCGNGTGEPFSNACVLTDEIVCTAFPPSGDEPYTLVHHGRDQYAINTFEDGETQIMCEVINPSDGFRHEVNWSVVIEELDIEWSIVGPDNEPVDGPVVVVADDEDGIELSFTITAVIAGGDGSFLPGITCQVDDGVGGLFDLDEVGGNNFSETFPSGDNHVFCQVTAGSKFFALPFQVTVEPFVELEDLVVERFLIQPDIVDRDTEEVFVEFDVIVTNRNIPGETYFVVCEGTHDVIGTFEIFSEENTFSADFPIGITSVGCYTENIPGLGSVPLDPFTVTVTQSTGPTNDDVFWSFGTNSGEPAAFTMITEPGAFSVNENKIFSQISDGDPNGTIVGLTFVATTFDNIFCGSDPETGISDGLFCFLTENITCTATHPLGEPFELWNNPQVSTPNFFKDGLTEIICEVENPFDGTPHEVTWYVDIEKLDFKWTVDGPVVAASDEDEIELSYTITVVKADDINNPLPGVTCTGENVVTGFFDFTNVGGNNFSGTFPSGDNHVFCQVPDNTEIPDHSFQVIISNLPPELAITIPKEITKPADDVNGAFVKFNVIVTNVNDPSITYSVECQRFQADLTPFPISSEENTFSADFPIGTSFVICKTENIPERGIVTLDLFTVTVSDIIEPEPVEKKRGGGGCADCTPPTLGLDKNFKRIVDNGFSYNNSTVQVDRWHTQYPLINATVGETNTVEIIIYENNGINNLKMAQFGLGGQEIGQSLSTFEVLIQVPLLYNSTSGNMETDEITIRDKDNLIENSSVIATASDVSCGATSSFCLKVTLEYSYREPTIYHMMVVNVWDKPRNSQNFYFNEGIKVLGESLNEPLTFTLHNKQTSQQTEDLTLILTRIDKVNHIWEDKYGIQYLKVSDNRYDRITPHDEYVCNDPPLSEINVPTRGNCHFRALTNIWSPSR